MTKTKTNTTADDLAATRAASREAEAQHREALDRATLVRTQLDELRAGVIAGTPATAEELATAAAAVPHADLLAEAAAHALERTRAAQRAAMSTHYAEELRGRLDLEEFDAFHEAELEALRGALRTYISGLTKRNSTIRTAIPGARAVGIGHTNDHGEGVSLSGALRNYDLWIDGRHVREVKPHERAVKVLEAAFLDNGLILTASARQR